MSSKLGGMLNSKGVQDVLYRRVYQSIAMLVPLIFTFGNKSTGVTQGADLTMVHSVL